MTTRKEVPIYRAADTPPAAPATEPIVVSSNQSVIDGVQAGLRYLVVLLTLATAAAGFVRVRDFAGLVAFIQSNGGQFVAAILGLIGLGTAFYGIFKTHLRGGQIATVALDKRVPDDVATTSD
jgi:hypothetical protein